MDQSMTLCVRGYAFAHAARYVPPMDSKMGARIKAIRLKSGLGQTEFAEHFDVSQSTVGRWEKGSVPQGDKLQKLADLGGMTVHDLLGAPPVASEGISEADLRQAILDAFPLPPVPLDEQAAYLAGTVLKILALPPAQHPIPANETTAQQAGRAKGAPARRTTKRT
jgi:transcriptional regulator with XRE-family HTH domain